MDVWLYSNKWQLFFFRCSVNFFILKVRGSIFRHHVSTSLLGTSPITMMHHSFLVSHTADLHHSWAKPTSPLLPSICCNCKVFPFCRVCRWFIHKLSAGAKLKGRIKKNYFVSQEFVACDVADGWEECDWTKGAAIVIHLISDLISAQSGVILRSGQ